MGDLMGRLNGDDFWGRLSGVMNNVADSSLYSKLYVLQLSEKNGGSILNHFCEVRQQVVYMPAQIHSQSALLY